MDLRSLDTRASWHPLTSLILLFDGAWADRPFYGIPWVVSQDIPTESGSWRSAISTIHHELTHLFCARTTRLGWTLGATAAKAIADWRAGRAVILSRQVEVVLAAYTPILEGLALYTELDFQARDYEAILSNPVTVHAQLVEFDRQDMEWTLRLAREAAIIDEEDHDPGLLRRLFCHARANRAFYLAGYLWVKSVAALIARRCPAFAPPARMLPLLVRILCDHPAIWHALDGRYDAPALLRTIHESVLAMTADHLQGLATMVETVPEAVALFDWWDIQGQIASGQFSSLVRTSDSNYRQYFEGAIATALQDDLLTVRTAASIHLLSSTRGTVQQVSDDKVLLDVGTGAQLLGQYVHLLSIEKVWSSLAGQMSPEDRTQSSQRLRIAKGVQDVLGMFSESPPDFQLRSPTT